MKLKKIFSWSREEKKLAKKVTDTDERFAYFKDAAGILVNCKFETMVL